MANEISITIKAQDAASKVFSDVETHAHGLMGTLARVGEIAGGVFAGQLLHDGIRKLGEGLLSTIHSAQESAAIHEQLAAVLKSTGGAAGVTAGAAEELAQSLQRTTTFSDEAVGSVENLLLTFTNIKNNVFPQTTAVVLDMATALGEDTKNAAIQVGKALQDPILGIGSLHRVGVAFTEAQKEQIKTLVQSGKTLEAQKIILHELATEFGGSAAAAAQTFGGRIEQLKNQIDDMKEKVGNALMHALIPVVNFASGALAGLGDGFDTSAIERSLLNIQIAVVNMVINAKSNIDDLKSSLGSIGGFFKSLDDANEKAKAKVRGFFEGIGVNPDKFNMLNGGAGNVSEPGWSTKPPVEDSPLVKLRDQLKDALANVGKDVEGTHKVVPVFNQDIDDAGASLKSLKDRFDKMLSTPSKELAELQLRLSQATLAAHVHGLTTTPLIEKLRAQIQIYGDIDEVMKAMKVATVDATQSEKERIGSLSDVYGSFTTGLGDAAPALAGMAGAAADAKAQIVALGKAAADAATPFRQGWGGGLDPTLYGGGKTSNGSAGGSGGSGGSGGYSTSNNYQWPAGAAPGSAMAGLISVNLIIDGQNLGKALISTQRDSLIAGGGRGVVFTPAGGFAS